MHVKAQLNEILKIKNFLLAIVVKKFSIKN